MASILELVNEFIEKNGSINIRDIVGSNKRELYIPEGLKTFPDTKDILGRICEVGEPIIVAGSKQSVVVALCLGFTKGGGVRCLPFGGNYNTTSKTSEYFNPTIIAKSFSNMDNSVDLVIKKV